MDFEPIREVVLRRLEKERGMVDPIMKGTTDENDDGGNQQHEGTPAMEKTHDNEDSAHQNEVTPAVKKMKIN